ncbi:hypothetical protein ACJX0J_012041, partial [Zea mays]
VVPFAKKKRNEYIEDPPDEEVADDFTDEMEEDFDDAKEDEGDVMDDDEEYEDDYDFEDDFESDDEQDLYMEVLFMHVYWVNIGGQYVVSMDMIYLKLSTTLSNDVVLMYYLGLATQSRILQALDLLF